MTDKQALTLMVHTYKWKMRANLATSDLKPKTKEDLADLLGRKVTRWLHDIEEATPNTMDLVKSTIKVEMDLLRL